MEGWSKYIHSDLNNNGLLIVKLTQKQTEPLANQAVPERPKNEKPWVTNI